MSGGPIRVLFVSTSNATRSILAEAILRHAGGSAYEAHSAGIEPSGGIADLTLRMLEDAGIERAGLRSKSVEEYRDQPFDYVVTVCDDARGRLPGLPGCGPVAPLGLSGSGGLDVQR